MAWLLIGAATMTPRNASAIVNCATRYEVIATDGKLEMRLAFTARHTKAALLHFMRSSAADIVKRFDLGADATIGAYGKASGWSACGNGRTAYVRFSGRTERECYWSE
jgi:hypothetical protein